MFLEKPRAGTYKGDIMTAVNLTQNSKTIIALENVFLENVEQVEGTNNTFAKGKVIQMTGTNERQWTVLFTTWDCIAEVKEIAANPKDRYTVRGYLRNQKSKSDGKWYTNFVITSVN
jgi:hypothetical protein